MGITTKIAQCFLNRVFGVLTERQVLASTLKAGRRITYAAKKGPVTAENLTSIFTRSVPRGIKTPQVMSSQEDLVKYLVSEGMPIEKARQMAQCAGGGVMPGMFYIPETNQGVTLADSATHEFRHLLDGKSNFIEKIIKNIFTSLKKILPQKQYEKIVKAISKGSSQVNYERFEVAIKSNLGINSNPNGVFEAIATKKGLLKIMQCSEQEFDNYWTSKIRKILSADNPKMNLRKLNSLKKFLMMDKDAYGAGGRIVHNYKLLGKKLSTGSEMVSALHKEIIELIDKERIIQQANLKLARKGLPVPPTDVITQVESPSKLYTENNFIKAYVETVIDAVSKIEERPKFHLLKCSIKK